MTIPAGGFQSPAQQVRRVFLQHFEDALPEICSGLLAGARELELTPGPAASGSRPGSLERMLAARLSSWSQAVAHELRVGLEFGQLAQSVRELPLGEDTQAGAQWLAFRMAVAVMRHAGGQFEDLRARVTRLEQKDELEARDFLRPDVIASIAVNAWQSADLSLQAWEDLQPFLHETVGQQLEQSLQAANRWCMEHGVMPELGLRPVIDEGRPPPGAAMPEPPPRPSLPATDQPLGVQIGPAPEDVSHQRVLAALRRLSGGISGQQPGGAGEAAFQATMLHSSPGRPEVAQAAATAPGDGTMLAPLSQTSRSMPRLPQAVATQDERTAIEVVALLFHSILAEERLPPAVRVWFARLQMPVLRVAVTEPDFFASSDHPARRLIDRLGACVMGFGRNGLTVDEALEVEVKRIVQVVEAYPDSGRRVFQTVLAELDKFLGTYFREHAETGRATVSLAQQMEQRETLAIQHTIEFRRMLEGVPVQDGVRQFLFDAWADVLATVSVSQGAHSERARAMKRVAADLVWSAGAKVTREERADALRRLPGLLKSIREGMALAGLPADRQEDLIKRLNNSLTEGFTAKAAPLPQRKLQDLMEQLQALEEMMAEAQPFDIDASILRDIPGASDTELEVVLDGGGEPIAAMLAWARELPVGSWYMLKYGGVEQPVKLVWHGARKHLSLFVSADGHCRLFQQHRLAAYLQSALLQPAQDEDLTIKAIRGVLDTLSLRSEPRPE